MSPRVLQSYARYFLQILNLYFFELKLWIVSTNVHARCRALTLFFDALDVFLDALDRLSVLHKLFQLVNLVRLHLLSHFGQVLLVVALVLLSQCQLCYLIIKVPWGGIWLHRACSDIEQRKCFMQTVCAMASTLEHPTSLKIVDDFLQEIFRFLPIFIGLLESLWLRYFHLCQSQL
jgi:hypothetical protein